MLSNYTKTLFALELWQLASLAAALVVSFSLSYTFARLTLFVTRRIVATHFRLFDRQELRPLLRPVRWLYMVAIVAAIVPFLELASTPHSVITTSLKFAALFSATWLIFRIFDVVINHLSSQVGKGHAGVTSMLPLIRRSGKTLIGILAIVASLQNLHIDVTALIAGLGVGGIAIALASQKTLENLFGGVMIILDQPIRVGEECRFGTQTGVVEDIGLRSTRIRTPERSVIAVPNSDLSQMQIENLTLRDRIRLSSSFGLRYETTADQLRNVLIEIRKILYAHPKIDRDPARVRLVNFGAQAIEIEIVAYVLTSSATEHLAIKEDILLRIMQVVHDSGTAFALPSLVNYRSEHDFLDSQLKAESEARVAALRKAHQLPLPEFSDDQIADMDDTIDYPPLGAANDNPKVRYS